MAEQEAGITHRTVTLVIAGDEAPDYNTPVFQNGRGVGKLTSPSAGRSPTVDKLIAMATIDVELTTPGSQVEVTLPDGRLVPAIVDTLPDLRPAEDPAPQLAAKTTMDPDGPIGVIASGSGAAALVADLRRRMPHEDVISMSDDGHPAWARLRGTFVQERVRAITVDLCNAGAKLIILGSLQGTLDGLDAARAATPAPVIGIDLRFAVDRAFALSRGGPVAIVAGSQTVRIPQLQGALKRLRSGGLPLIDPRAGEFGGYRGLVLAGGPASSTGARIAAAADPGAIVVDTAAVAAAQAHRLLARSAGLAHRRRAGRQLRQSSYPAAAPR